MKELKQRRIFYDNLFYDEKEIASIICFIFMQNISNPKQPSCKKVCSPQKGYGEKRYEIQGGGQEMAVMVG